jgi:hypothetical protein
MMRRILLSSAAVGAALGVALLAVSSAQAQTITDSRCNPLKSLDSVEKIVVKVVSGARPGLSRKRR